ncbi:MAG: energy transducer TonB [Muribaculum sp.]|nr:energy transducer TonB [Muribaculum sp.]
MMYKSKPSRMRRLAGIAVIPAAIVALAITDIPAVADVISETESAKLLAVSDSKVSNFSSDAQVKADETTTEEPVKVVAVGYYKKGEDPVSVETMMLKQLDEMQVVAPANPDAKLTDESSASNNKSEITYFVNGVEMPAAVAEKLNPNNIESISVERPDQTNPQKGNIIITLKNDDASPSNGTSNKEVFTAVDKVPEYPGGMEEMLKYLAYNTRYPEEAMMKNIQGRVIVKFIISKDGEVMEPSIVKGVDPSLDQEALRVVNSMPKWTPGSVQGKPVSCFFTLPVNFRLQENVKEPESAKKE